MKPKPLKGKEMIFEQDYIETEIKWNLALGDKIFKKKDIHSAVEFLKERIWKNTSMVEHLTDKQQEELESSINEAFEDVTK